MDSFGDDVVCNGATGGSQGAHLLMVSIEELIVEDFKDLRCFGALAFLQVGLE